MSEGVDSQSRSPRHESDIVLLEDQRRDIFERVRPRLEELLKAVPVYAQFAPHDRPFRLNPALIKDLEEMVKGGDSDGVRKKCISLIYEGYCSAHRLFNDIHVSRKGKRRYSTPGNEPNEFTRRFAAHHEVARRAREGCRAAVLGVGANAGDAISLANLGFEVDAIDTSMVACESVSCFLRERFPELRINVINDNYLQRLMDDNESRTGGYSCILSYSSIHYFLDAYLREDILPLIQASLIKNNGIFGLGMKTMNSDSAKRIVHPKLLDLPDFVVKIELRRARGGKGELMKSGQEYGILRIYPSAEFLEKTLRESFELIEYKVERVEGYEDALAVDMFAHGIMTPKIIRP